MFALTEWRASVDRRLKSEQNASKRPLFVHGNAADHNNRSAVNGQPAL